MLYEVITIIDQKKEGCANMSDISCCGTECSTCYCYGNMCNGCNKCEGKVFHAPKDKGCAIYECAINQKHLKNCRNNFV